MALFTQLFEALAIGWAYFDQCGDVVDGLFQILYLGRRDFQRIGEKIMRQYSPVAIHDHAARRRDRHQRNAVVFRQRVVIVVAQKLEMEKTRGEDAKADQHDDTGHPQAQAEKMLLLPVISQLESRIHAVWGGVKMRFWRQGQ